MKEYKVIDRYETNLPGDVNALSDKEKLELQIKVQRLSIALNMWGKTIYEVIDPKTKKVLGYKSPPRGFDEHKFTPEQKNAVRLIIGLEVLEQGCLVYYQGEKYPIRHFTSYSLVSKMATVKYIFSFLLHPLREKSIVKKAIGALFLFQNKNRIIDWLASVLSDEIYPEPRFYGQAVAELYRATGKYAVNLRNVLCMTIDSDTAYKFRLQDMFQNLDKKLLIKKPLKEIDRIMEIGFMRESTDEKRRRELGQTATVPDGLAIIRKAWPMIKLYLFLNRNLLKEIKNVLMELDVEEISPHRYDLYYMYKFYPDYDFNGYSYEERLKLAEAL